MREKRIKIQRKFRIAALEGGSTTKICGHVDKCVENAHAKFYENRLNGLGDTGRRLLIFTFSLRKSNGLYLVNAQYIANGWEYCIKNWHACSLSGTPALV